MKNNKSHFKNDEKSQPIKTRRFYKPIPISDVAYIICKPTMEKMGLIFSELYLNWANVVGAEISKICWPEKISKNNSSDLILTLKVNKEAVIEVNYSKNKILKLVCDFVGNDKILEIKICH